MKNRKILFFISALVVTLFIGVGQGEARKSHKVMHMPADKIAEFIKASKGDKRIIMVYTSWCPFCRQILPKVMDIERIKPGSVIAIAEDQDIEEFVKYINQYGDVPFMIILSKYSKTNTLANNLKPLGVKPWKGYPNFILLDGENGIVEQGNLEADSLANFILEKNKE